MYKLNYSDYKIGIIGPGRVGSTLAHIWSDRDITISIKGRNFTKTKEKFSLTKIDVFHSVEDLANNSDIVFICTQEKDIQQVVSEVNTCLNSSQILVHTSGSLKRDILKFDKNTRYQTAVFHPYFSFPHDHIDKIRLKKSYIGIVAEDDIKPVLRYLADILGAVPISISENVLPLYHSSATLLCSGIILLNDIARELLVHSGVDRNIASDMVKKFSKEIIKNICEIGIDQSLTGPWERKALQVIESHIESITKTSPENLDVYISLVKKFISEKTIEEILRKKDDERS